MAANNVPGPYWLNISDDEAQVCGRHGKIMFRYPADQEALAAIHVARLQKGHAKAAKATATELLTELREECRDWQHALSGEREGLDGLCQRVDAFLASVSA